MKICVLLPDYSTTDVDYKNYDPPRNLSHLLPNDEVHHVFLNKLTTYKQLKELSQQQFDCFVNLCEGYLEWSVPSIEVIYFLELLNLPFTGPSSILYDPPKELMKYVAYTVAVKTASYFIIKKNTDLIHQIQHVQFPLFVKPAKAGDSLGIDEYSLVQNIKELENKIQLISNEFDEILVEEYIEGREFTVLVFADTNDEKNVIALEPIEYIFPEGKHFKTYALKTSELHPECNILLNDKKLISTLKTSSINIFRGFNAVGYARLDFRMNAKNEIFFLEINFTCSTFYNNGYEGSADYILKLDGLGQQGFLKHIINEGIARHKRNQKKYVMKGNSIAGFGIYAKEKIHKGEIIFKGEEKSQRIVTKSFVEKNWNQNDLKLFKQYAYPLSQEVYVLWDLNPLEWAPQNHSCNANTTYIGLNVVANRAIEKGEELTLDYSLLLNEESETFQCNCGSSNCKGIITGNFNNSISNNIKSL